MAQGARIAFEAKIPTRSVFVVKSALCSGVIMSGRERIEVWYGGWDSLPRTVA